MSDQLEKISVAATAIATVVAAVSAVLSFWTLLEIRKQRRNSYRPDVLAASTNIYFYSKRFNLTWIPFDYSPEEFNTEIRPLPSYKPIILSLFNAGFAAAKNVTFSWKFDIVEMVRMIESTQLNDYFKIEYKKDPTDREHLLIQIPSLQYNHIIFHPYDTSIIPINYIIPSPENPALIIFPTAYLDLFIMIMCIRQGYFGAGPTHDLGTLYTITHDDIPPLFFDVSFRDMDNKKRSKTFKFEIVYNGGANPDFHAGSPTLLGNYLFFPTEV